MNGYQNYPSGDRPKLDEKISPALVCTILTVLMIIGVIWGFAAKSPLVIVIFLLPVVAYEIYRTRGASTIMSSWLLAIVLVLEIIFIVFGISWDLGRYLNLEYSYIGGQYVPLGDIKILAPVLLAVFSTVLFLRTAGPYTKWLSVIIFVSAFIIIYVMSPEMFRELLRSSIQRILWYF